MTTTPNPKKAGASVKTTPATTKAPAPAKAVWTPAEAAKPLYKILLAGPAKVGKTRIDASFIVAFDGTKHRYLRDGQLV